MQVVCGPPTHSLRSELIACIFVVCLLQSVSAELVTPTQADSALSPLASPQPAAGPPNGSTFVAPSDARRFDQESDFRFGNTSPETISRIQSGLPPGLILPPPSPEALAIEDRFVQAAIDPQIPLPLALGRPKILQFKETPIRIFLPNDSIATAEILDRSSGREIAITGLKPGSTTLSLWFNDSASPEGRSIVNYLVQVFADPLITRPIGNLQQEINATFQNCKVELVELGGRLVVKGQAQDALQVTQILQILAGARGVTTGITRPGNIPTVGSTYNFADTDAFAQEEEAALRRETFDPLALARAGIVNLLRIPGEQQVMLRVTVAEVNRTAARNIGLNFGAIVGNNVVQTSTGGLINPSGLGNQNAPGNLGVNANIQASLDSGQVQLGIEALRKLNLSRTLAEPNLVTMNGIPATFRAGGQFPIPVLSSGGAGGQNLQGVNFVPFGIQLRFVPLIQDRDVIRLQLNASVSTRDESIGTSIGGGGGGGTQVSGLNSRNVSTSVELRSGQTLAVAGILQSNFGSSSDRIPFFGDLPIIGSLSGVNRTSAGETELVILVTPELVAPVDACDSPPLPGSDIFEPTDIEFYIKNRLESRRTTDYRSTVRTDYARQRVPDKCCPDKYFVGPVGPSDRCCNRLGSFQHWARPVLKTDPLASSTPSIITDEIVSDPESAVR